MKVQDGLVNEPLKETPAIGTVLCNTMAKRCMTRYTDLYL
jgi:hypothetical protein